MKIKRFDITVEFIRDIFSSGTKHWKVIRNALPEDAELVRIYVSQNKSTPDILSLYFTSNSFQDLPEGTNIGSEPISILKYYPIKQHEYLCNNCEELAKIDIYNPNYMVCGCENIGQIDINKRPESWKEVLTEKIIIELE